MQLEINDEEYRKFFGFFIKANNIMKNPKFKKTDYGFRTFTNLDLGNWKLFKSKNQIVKHRTVEKLLHGEYVKCLEETVYKIIKYPNKIKATFVELKTIC